MSALSDIFTSDSATLRQLDFVTTPSGSAPASYTDELAAIYIDEAGQTYTQELTETPLSQLSTQFTS